MHSGGGNAWMKIMGIKDKKKGKKEKKGELETLGQALQFMFAFREGKIEFVCFTLQVAVA